MADNVAVTAGSGTSIATDQLAGGEHVQFVKLMDGTLNGETKAAVSVRGLSVDTGGSSCGDGRKTCATAGTREQFSSQACKYVILVGEENNTDIVVIGGSTVVAAASGGGTTRQGIPLAPLQSIRLEISNLNLLYIDAVTSTDGVTYAWFA